MPDLKFNGHGHRIICVQPQNIYIYPHTRQSTTHTHTHMFLINQNVQRIIRRHLIYVLYFPDSHRVCFYYYYIRFKSFGMKKITTTNISTQRIVRHRYRREHTHEHRAEQEILYYSYDFIYQN